MTEKGMLSGVKRAVAAVGATIVMSACGGGATEVKQAPPPVTTPFQSEGGKEFIDEARAREGITVLEETIVAKINQTGLPLVKDGIYMVEPVGGIDKFESREEYEILAPEGVNLRNFPNDSDAGSIVGALNYGAHVPEVKFIVKIYNTQKKESERWGVVETNETNRPKEFQKEGYDFFCIKQGEYTFAGPAGLR